MDDVLRQTWISRVHALAAKNPDNEIELKELAGALSVSLRKLHNDKNRGLLAYHKKGPESSKCRIFVSLENALRYIEGFHFVTTELKPFEASPLGRAIDRATNPTTSHPG